MNPKKEVNRIPNTTCHVCSKPIYQRPGQMAKGSKAFCSAECRTSMFTVSVDVTCPVCDKVFKPSNRASKHCSRICANKSRYGITYNNGAPNCKVTHVIRQRRVLATLYGNKCSECGQLPEWNGKPLTLQVDHINGDNTDNSIDNIRLLCPNCHTQTETYAGRNIGNLRKRSDR